MEKQQSKGYKVARKIWESDREIAVICQVSNQAVNKWKYNGIPKKRRQSLVDASNGKIKSIDQLKG